MVRVDEARDLAARLLADELPRRFSHVRGVASRAERLASVASDDRSPLVAAAWLHDIGYASGLVDTGFHPIDGARYLRRTEADERVVNLVAHYSCAVIEADLRGLGHSSTRAALIYQHARRDRERAIADAVSAKVSAELGRRKRP